MLIIPEVTDPRAIDAATPRTLARAPKGNPPIGRIPIMMSVLRLITNPNICREQFNWRSVILRAPKMV